MLSGQKGDIVSSDLELEIDEGLNVGGLDLNDYPDDKDNQQSLDGKGQTGDDALGPLAPGLGQEMERIA